MNLITSQPHFIIKRNFQKRGYSYKDILTPDILSDICKLTTGRVDYTVEWDDSDYNKGRLVKLLFKSKIFYITLSNEGRIEGRNSALQSVPSAMNRFILEENINKEMCYYFLPLISGSFSTDYFMFMYRLMKTASVNFLNADQFIENPIVEFASPDDIITTKDQVRNRNSANRSTYITTGPKNQIQIFGKTYGASKYETTILCLAISEIALRNVELYEIEEGGLTKLPAASKEAIESLGKISIHSTNRTIERREFVEHNSLRSPRYIFNLLEKLGDKKCTLCDCEISQIIQGAHIWPVADIKKQNHLTEDEKLNLAIDGNNGLWLCQNHHRLFDVNFIAVGEDGEAIMHPAIRKEDADFIRTITTEIQIPKSVINDSFRGMLNRRNTNLDLETYIAI